MSLKAKLSIVLKADDVVIAETTDAKLWLKMLTSLIEEQASAAAAGNAQPTAQHSSQENHPHASAVSA